MAKVKDHIAQLGLGTLVAGLKALEKGVSKKQYRRLIATAVAQLLTLLPDYDLDRATRRARKVAGARPAKKMLVEPGKVGLKEGLKTAVVAAASSAALTAASKVAGKVTDKVKDAVEAKTDGNQPVHA
jgi:hypothetical protein